MHNVLKELIRIYEPGNIDWMGNEKDSAADED